MKVLTTAAPDTAEWHAARAGKIGGSSAADILCGHMPDVHTRGSALEVWVRLKDEREGKVHAPPAEEERDEDERDRLWWGHASEGVHLSALQKATGWTINGPPGVLQDDELEWLVGAPDGSIEGRDGFGMGIAELKAPTTFYGRAQWQEGIAPLAHQIQVAVYMRIWALDWSLISAFTPPRRKPTYMEVVRAPQFEDWMIAGLSEFWERNVLADVPPDPTYRQRDYSLIRDRIYPGTNGQTIELPPETVAAVRRREELSAEINRLERENDQLKATIAMAMGENAIGILDEMHYLRSSEEGRAVTKKDILEALAEAKMLDAIGLVDSLKPMRRMLRKMTNKQRSKKR